MRILYHPKKKEFLLPADYPNCLVAYSFRKVNSLYNGYCCQVRRFSDNALKDIGFVNGVLDTATLLDWLGGSSASIRWWYDQSGNGHRWVSTQWDSRQPILVNAGVLNTDGGKPCVVITGIQYFEMDNVISNVGPDISLFTVAKLTSTAANWKRLLTGYSNFNFLLGANASGNIMSIYGDRASWGQSTANSATSWLNIRRLVTSINNGYDNQFVNGNPVTPRENPMSIFTGEISITAFVPEYWTQPWNGTLQEVIIFNEDKLSTRGKIEKNINNFYSIY